MVPFSAVFIVLQVAFWLFLLTVAGPNRIMKALGPSTLLIIAKVAGLLLTALAIQLMILGLTDLGLIEGFAAH